MLIIGGALLDSSDSWQERLHTWEMTYRPEIGTRLSKTTGWITTSNVIGLESGVTAFLFRNGSGEIAHEIGRGILEHYKDEIGR